MATMWNFNSRHATEIGICFHISIKDGNAQVRPEQYPNLREKYGLHT
jgi:hypothetical protein